MRRTISWMGTAGLLVAASFVGCSPFSGYCADVMDCEGGNDYDIDACVADLDHLSSRADVWDCRDDFDFYWECLEERGHCDDHIWTTNDDCHDEWSDYNDCID